MTFDQRPQSFGRTGPGHDKSRVRARTTDATRYLCAGAYLDEDFAKRVIDEIMHQPNRAIAPSYGVDLGPIIRHCLAARRLLLTRDGVVTAMLMLVLVVAVANGATIMLGVVALWLVVGAVRLFGKRAVDSGLLFLAVAAAVAAVPLFFVLRGVSQTGEPGSGGYPAEQESGGGTGVLWVLALAVIWGAYFWYRVEAHRLIATGLTPVGFDGGRAPAAGSEHERRLEYIEQAQWGNITVYSPDWAARPFVGSGVVMTEWNLVTPLRPAQTDLAAGILSKIAADGGHDSSGGAPVAGVASFDVHTLYERTRDGLMALADPSLLSDERLNQLSVQDRVFVAGLLPADSPFLDPQRRPIFRMATEAVDAVDRAERGQVRHYQTVRMAAWRGELEVTIFLYAAIRGGMLFVEFVAAKLPGIRPEFHQIDSYERPGRGPAVAAGVRAIVDVFACPQAVVNVGARAAEAIGRVLDRGVTGKEIDRRLAFDYGARSSVREIGAHFSQLVRFQDYDANERVSLVERRLLEIVVDTLREYGYDVGDLVGQATTIINNSTLVGSVSGTGIAVGAGARSTVASGQQTATARPSPETPR